MSVIVCITITNAEDYFPPRGAGDSNSEPQTKREAPKKKIPFNEEI